MSGTSIVLEPWEPTNGIPGCTDLGSIASTSRDADLADVSQQISFLLMGASTATVDDAVTEALSLLVRAVGAASASTWQTSSDLDRLRRKASWPTTSRHQLQSSIAITSSTALSAALLNGETRILSLPEFTREHAGEDKESTSDHLLVPVTAGGITRAAVTVELPKGASINTDCLGLVQWFADLLPIVRARTEATDRAVLALDSSPLATSIRDVHGRLIDCNQRFVELLGHPDKATLIGSNICEVVDLAEAQRGSVDWKTDTDGPLDVPYLRVDGRTVWGRTSTRRIETSHCTYIVTHIDDITHQRLLERDLDWAAHHDELTGLLNRRALLAAMDDLVRCGERCATLLVDLDGFKMTNDSLGHEVGDAMLRSVADRLASVARSNDIVARLGGDEFVILLVGLDHHDKAMRIATRILSEMRRPHRVAGNDLFASGSIGIAMTEPDDDAESLLRKADTAMYAAKAQGKNCAEVWDDRHRNAAAARQEIELDLRRAAHTQAIEVRYQPVYDLQTGEPRGAEALVRWRGADNLLIDASKFVDVARDAGVLHAMSEAALESACLAGSRWAAGRTPEEFTLRVHISATQLGRRTIVPHVARVLECTGFPAANLCLTFDEASLMTQPDSSQQTLSELHELGVQLSVDSFGKGLGSILQLRKFPIDELKMAPEIVLGVDDDPDLLSIAEMIVLLADSMDLLVVADGIEEATQVATMLELGVPQGQGYHLDPPLSALEFSDLLTLHDRARYADPEASRIG